MPPALVEDGEAATVEEGEESAIGRFLWSLVPGSSLVGAYRDYQKGSYVSAGLNGISGLSDLLSLGAITKAKSSLKLLVGFMKVRVKDALADEAANQAGVAIAERLGPEAGFVTQIIVSATLSKNLSQQNKAQLGFANGVGKNTKGSYASKLLPIPQVLEPKLKNLVNDLYKGAKTPKPYGTGSTADAVRNELLTGLPTYGTFHFKKAQQYSIALRNWLRDKPKASYYDRLVAQSLLDDLMAALGGN